MYVAFDDTDSASGMCTTFLATEVIARSGLDVIGYPRLVRLNPNISYKTRGNGAVVLRLGKGSGKKFPVGELDGRIIHGFEKEQGPNSEENLLDIVSSIVEEYAELNDVKTNPGIVLSEKELDESLYLDALRREVSIEETEKYLSRLGLAFRKFKNGRGIIGSAAAIAWRGRRKTFEILSYDYPRPGSHDHKLLMDAARFVDTNYKETFNNIDQRNRDAAIFPANRTPVVYGIRSVSADRLMETSNRLSEKFGISGPRRLIYETNQGTDDHIITSPAELWETGSFAIKGEITDIPEAIRGGHYFTGMKYRNNRLKLAAFEPTKEFRNIFRKLRPGDIVEVVGSYLDKTLNVEKMRLLTLSRFFRRIPPACSSCGNQMKSHGRNDYRCRCCGGRSATPSYTEEKRDIVPGNYEVPVSARRHLSMPLKLEPYFLENDTVMARGGGK